MAKTAATPVFLLVLAAIATALVVIIVAPFAGALFAAAVVAGVLHPAQKWLAVTLGDRPAVAAGVLTTLVVVIVLGPLATLGVYGTEQLSAGIKSVVRTVDEKGVDGLLERIPESLRPHARDAIDRIPQSILPRHHTPAERRPDGTTKEPNADVETAPSESDRPGIPQLDLGGVASWVAQAVRTATELIVDIGVLVLALFFLLSQGARLVDWIISVIPLSEAQSGELLARSRDVSRAVFVATLGSALIQTVIGGIGFMIAGVPWLPVALLFTFIAALVPIIGGATIVIAAGIITWLDGQMGYGLFLIGWGLIPVGLSDNLVKPLLTERDLRLPASIVFFAMLGGMSVFGPMGVVAGPLVLAFFTSTLGLMRSEGWIRE